MAHVVHHPGYRTPAQAGTFRWDKYGLLIEALRADGGPLTLHQPEPMPRAWIEAVHDPAYVAEVIEQRVPPEKTRRIGFAVNEAVALRSILSPGGTWLAAKLALDHGHAANGAGGSHHAQYDTGAGYCVFNDLAIAANRLVTEGDVRRILIVDVDVHQGDGTAALLAGRTGIATYSIHADKNFPARKARSTLDVPLPDGTGDAAYLDALAGTLPVLVRSVRPDLILYQAGVDPHVDDRLGRLALTDEGLRKRDMFVGGLAKGLGIPIASALGGGYGDDGMAIARRHAASIRAVAEALCRCSSSPAKVLGGFGAEVQTGGRPI